MHSETNPAINDCQADSDDPRYGSVCNQCCGLDNCTGGPDTGFTWDGDSTNADFAQQLINVFHNN